MAGGLAEKVRKQKRCRQQRSYATMHKKDFKIHGRKRGPDSTFSSKRGPGCPNAEKGCSKLFHVFARVHMVPSCLHGHHKKKLIRTAPQTFNQNNLHRGVRPEAPGIFTHTLSFASPEAIRHRQTCARADTNGPRPFPIAHLGSDPWSTHSSYRSQISPQSNDKSAAPHGSSRDWPH